MSPPPVEPPHRRARYWRLPTRRRRWLGLLGWSLWAIAGLVVAIAGGSYIYLDDTLEAAAPNTPKARAARAATRPVLPGRPVNVLLIGSDTRPEEGDPGRSDSLILLRMDAARGFISMLSFPRDLYVQIPGVGQGKINSAYSLGPEKTIQTVQELVGEDVNEYVIIDFEGFERLVQEVGGVYLDVDRRYFHVNTVCPGPDCYDELDLQPGYQRLDGRDALDFVRYRHGDSDYARIARQQIFLSELKRQTKQLGNLRNLSGFRRIFGTNVEMSIDEVPRFLSLLELALRVPKDRIARNSIKGSGTLINGQSSEVASASEIATKVAAWKDPRFEDERAPAKRVDPATVDVTVLNGNGRVLAGEDLAQLVADKGYRARVGGNADTFDYATSSVFYAPGFLEPARRISTLLGPTTSLAPLTAADARGNEVIVVAGADFSGTLPPPPPPAVASPADTIDTTSVVAPLRDVQRALGLRVMAPLKVAGGSRLRLVRPYRINTGSGSGGPPAVKLVFETGYHKYWGITMTSMKNPPILQGETGSFTSGGRRYLTYYDGKTEQRLAFQAGGVTYWVSNTLDGDLSSRTIEEIAKSMRPLNRATLPKGRTDTAISVETEGSTP